MGFQSDAFSKGGGTERERFQNETRHCKTDLGSHERQNENPGALAGATGAHSKDQQIRGEVYNANTAQAMPDSPKDRRIRAARALGNILMAGAPHLWEGFAVILKTRLTEDERGLLAYAALRSLEPEPREMAFNAAHWGAVQLREEVSLTLMSDARAWARHASPDELKAYAVAAYDALGKTDQLRFCGYVMRGAA